MILVCRMLSAYRGPGSGYELWPVGEAREATEAQASYLQTTFPGLWEVVPPRTSGAPAEPEPLSSPAEPAGGPALDASIRHPDTNRAMRSPADVGGALDGHWRSVVKAIEDGEHDRALPALLQAERGGKGRASILDAIEARLTALKG